MQYVVQASTVKNNYKKFVSNTLSFIAIRYSKSIPRLNNVPNLFFNITEEL